MKKMLIPFACAALLFAAAGCITDNAKLPTPTANFVPKKTYAVSHEKLWQATFDALDNNHIAVTSADKADGILETDYIGGPGEVMIPFGISQITRYKYNISLRDESDGSVRLNIICTVEDSMSGGQNTSHWRDVSSQNAALVNRLQTWMYEQIENQLKG